jgi:predicted RNA-binding Zn-ribbon protein involved in translation (DUF1610 family)
METLNVNSTVDIIEKCVYCGSTVKLSREEVNNTTYFCPQCHRENVAWDLRKGFFGDPEYKETSVTWLFLGLISGILSLFFVPPIFGIVGMFCGYRCLSKGFYFAGGLVILFSMILMILGVTFGTYFFRSFL